MKRALFLRWSNLGAYIHDPLIYVRCAGRGALNLARARRDVLSSGIDIIGESWDEDGTMAEGEGREKRWHELPRDVSLATSAALTCSTRERVG